MKVFDASQHIFFSLSGFEHVVYVLQISAVRLEVPAIDFL